MVSRGPVPLGSRHLPGGNTQMSVRPAPPPTHWLNATVLGIGLASLCSDVGSQYRDDGLARPC